ncbi:MAG TPA: FAD-dependent monooxygenase [Pseudonocardia sp.]|jgi:2-polyprenyl-6-methoxyphenol hydroxylase-like FAD-dependent oxidoreductase|nr:FAD-dependent monooxygenase [Pseudonocardia sp.]
MDTDVLVVGAGPTGLLLAGDLAEAGVRVTVLERRASESNMTRAFAVHARTMEQLEIRGLADQLAKTGTSVRELRLFNHVRVDLGTLPTEFGSLLVTPQYQTERVLRRRVDELGVPVLAGVRVVGLAQDAAGVTVTAQDTDSTTTEHRAAYLVGADGVGSTVRGALGLPFPGHSVIKSMMLADVRLSTPPAGVLTVNAVGDAFAFVAPFGDGWYRVFAWNREHQVDDTAPLELAEVREVTRRALGTDFGMGEARWLSRFHSDERQVPRYRVGRVFLAGDAAHCHSPAGGQGMNTGLQDAANLGWKLAAAVRGWGDDALLDSYHSERHPVGRAVLRSSGAIIRLAMIRPRWGRAARNTLAGLLLRLPPARAAVAGSISAIGFRYPAPRGADRRVGVRVPNLALRTGRLYDSLHGGRFVLVGDAGELTLPAQVDAVAPARPLDRLLLVRPDGYLGWVGTAEQFPAWARDYFRT